MKTFCFTVDDNIRFLKELSQKKYNSIFDHPYLAVYKRLHDEFGVKVQLNLFYKTDDFDLSKMSGIYYSEWKENSDWLKLSFHSDFENVKPYEFSTYDEVYRDCKKVNDQIKRFASPDALAKTTTIHYCLTTAEGNRALINNNILGLLGIFGDEEKPIMSYGLSETNVIRICNGEIIKNDEISFASIDIVLNHFSKDNILEKLDSMTGRNSIRVMIHEQYFYSDYAMYQPSFEEKLKATFMFFNKYNYKSCFFEDLI